MGAERFSRREFITGASKLTIGISALVAVDGAVKSIGVYGPVNSVLDNVLTNNPETVPSVSSTVFKRQTDFKNLWKAFGLVQLACSFKSVENAFKAIERTSSA